MKIRGVDYHVDVVSEEGEPLVLLHGFTGSSQNWNEVIKEFSNYKLIVIDIIGHGQSASPVDPLRYKIEEVVRDLGQILNELNIEKVNLLGYSMGGRLALSFSMIYPTRVTKLILESSSPGLADSNERAKRKEADEKLAAEINSLGLVHFVDKWESLPLFKTQKKLSPSQQNSLRRQRLLNTSLGLANSLIGMGTGAQPSWWDKLQSLNIPVLLLCGEHDKKFCNVAIRMHELLTKSVRKEINGAGHAIHVEQPRIFGKIVNDFLK